MYRFEIRTAFLVLILALDVFSLTHNSSEPVKSSSVVAHESKLIPAVPLVADHPHVSTDNFTHIVRLEDVLMVFDVKELAAKWPSVRSEVKSECAHDMTEYFRGLQQHNIWAIKSKCGVP